MLNSSWEDLLSPFILKPHKKTLPTIEFLLSVRVNIFFFEALSDLRWRQRYLLNEMAIQCWKCFSYEFSFWLRWGIEAIFFFLGLIFFGWDGRLRQSSFRDEDIYKRVLCRTNGFLSKHFFFFFLSLLDLVFFLSDFNCLRYGICFCLGLFQLVCLEVHASTRGIRWGK